MRWSRVVSLPVVLVAGLILASLTLPGLTLADSPLAQDQAAKQCDLQPSLLTPAYPMPHVAAALRRDRLDVLVIGSGSTVGETGPANGPALMYHAPGTAYPYRMTDALRALRPHIAVNLTVKGARNLTAAEMLPMIRGALAQAHFDLVLWQTGTVEAVRGIRPDELNGELQDGAALLDKAHVDLVLVDPQFSRFLRATIDVNPYESVLRQVASMGNIPLFPRFDLTQAWVSDGTIDVEAVGRETRDQTITQLNDCLGQALARFVLAGSAER